MQVPNPQPPSDRAHGDADPPSHEERDDSVTAILRRASDGDDGSMKQLLGLVYADLRAISAKQLAGERGNHTLQPTALVHEAYLKLIRQEQRDWNDRVHFFAIASRIIRRILVDHARAKNALKRNDQIAPIEERTLIVTRSGELDLLDLDEALSKLTEIAPEAAQVVEMRFFGELTHAEVAEVMQSNEKAVAKHWSFAKAWLRRELSRGMDGPS